MPFLAFFKLQYNREKVHLFTDLSGKDGGLREKAGLYVIYGNALIRSGTARIFPIVSYLLCIAVQNENSSLPPMHMGKERGRKAVG